MEDSTNGSPPADLLAKIRQRTLALLASSQACCVICLDQVHEPCEAAPCRHRDFDYLCLVQWLSRTPRCPLCVQPVSAVKHKVDGKEVITPIRPPKQPEPEPAQRAPTQNDLFLDPYRLRNARERDARGRRSRSDRMRPHAQRSSGADGGINGRRRVYQQGLYSKHVGSNRMSRYRELCPALFNADPQLVSRARTFLRRELQVFPFLSGSHDEDDTAASSITTSARRRRADNAEFLLEYVIAVLKSVDLVGGRAEDLVAEFLGREHTRLFLHELRAWLRSPFEKLEDWDRAVQYAPPSPAPSSLPAPGGVGAARGRWQRRGGSGWPSARDRRKDVRRRADARGPQREGFGAE